MSVTLDASATHHNLALAALAVRFAARVGRRATLSADVGERRWRRFATAPEYDAWLIAWGPSSGIELHDHDGSTGVFHVVRGGLVERYRDAGAGTDFTTRDIRAHDTILVPASRIHEVRNPFRVETLSMHVYSPPLQSAPPNPF